MNGKLVWRTALAIFVVVFSAALVRNCKEIKQDHETIIRMQAKDHK